MEATRLIAIRHGETEWNALARIQGQLDIGLNARGRWQAAQLARALHDEAASAQQPIDAIHSSDLQRARDTAQPLAAALGLQPITDPALRERGFGIFEGRTFAEIQRQHPEQARRWSRREPEFAPEAGESLLVFRERVLRGVAEIAARHAGQQVVLVAHGGVLDVLYRAATRQPLDAPRSWSLDNATLNRLLWSDSGGFALVGWNDARHLAQEEAPLDEQPSVA